MAGLAHRTLAWSLSSATEGERALTPVLRRSSSRAISVVDHGSIRHVVRLCTPLDLARSDAFVCPLAHHGCCCRACGGYLSRLHECRGSGMSSRRASVGVMAAQSSVPGRPGGVARPSMGTSTITTSNSSCLFHIHILPVLCCPAAHSVQCAWVYVSTANTVVRIRCCASRLFRCMTAIPPDRRLASPSESLRHILRPLRGAPSAASCPQSRP